MATRRKPLPRRFRDEQIVTIDKDSAPRLIWFGEDLLLEELPVGTRVVYPRPPMEPLRNPGAAIRQALTHSEEMDPLHAHLRPGMRVTVAIDDISLPLPPMRTPDVRQIVLEAVLQMLDDYGVEDVHLVVATSLHRRMTESEMRRMVGKRIFDAFWPARFYNHDAEDPEGMVQLGKTRRGEPVWLSRRAAESDLVVYVNINLVPMDGGHKSVGVGLSNWETLRAHHNPRAIMKSDSYMDPSHSELHHACDRIGRVVEEHVKVFHIETALNNRMYGDSMSFLAKNEDDFTDGDRMKMQALRWTLRRLPRAARREVFMRVPSCYEMVAVHAGKAEPVHAKILEANFRQYAIPLQGQADIVITGIPYISPYNVNSRALNPLLVQVMGLGYFHNMYRNRPVLKKGGVLILAHPCVDDFDPDHHPSYIEMFNRLLTQTRDSTELEKHEEEFAKNPSYIGMYRRGHAYHGAHPFYMWYWGENGRAHAGKVIVVGSENRHVPEILGWERADTLSEAISMARSHAGRSAEITMLHHPPIFISDVE